MPSVYSATSSVTSSSQSTDNRTRAQACTELLNYVGGADNSDQTQRAGRAWDAAVRAFNSVSWTFNRVYTDLAVATDFDSTLGEATVPATFRTNLRAELLDSNNQPRDSVNYIEWANWKDLFPSQTGVGPAPTDYTLRNIHSTLKVIIEPRISGTPTWPTMRVHFHKRIALAPASDSTLDVPVEVDEAIFQLALANVIAMFKGHQEAIGAFVNAAGMRQEVENGWRDWPDKEDKPSR